MATIFVYGSLREGMYNYDRYLKDRVKSKKDAYVKGALYEIKGVTYPALVEGERMILGEIMDISDEGILSELDELEGFIEEGHVNNEYDKIMMDIYNESCEVINRLPVYMFNMRNPKHDCLLDDLIETDDYVAHCKQKDRS